MTWAVSSDVRAGRGSRRAVRLVVVIASADIAPPS
jgi:hypothetical protein